MENIRITPGPGLPSLESLGLTVEILAEEAFSDKHPGGVSGNSTAALGKRFTDHCSANEFGWDDIPAGLAGLCIAYFARLGSSLCAITGETTFCADYEWALVCECKGHLTKLNPHKTLHAPPDLQHRMQSPAFCLPNPSKSFSISNLFTRDAPWHLN